MKILRYLSFGLAIVALVLIALFRSLLGLGAWLLTAGLYGLLASWVLYRPPEDHLGVLYRDERFHRFATPDRWTYKFPWIDSERPPVNLQVRQTSVALTGLMTQDQVVLDCEVMVIYRVDPRGVERTMIPQVLGFAKADWDGIITSTLREAALQVVAGQKFLDLSSASGLRELKRALGTELAGRVGFLGLIVVPRTGVTVQTIRAIDAVRDALVQRYAAEAEGEATLAAMRPVLTKLQQTEIDNAPHALLLAWAAGIVQGDSPPSILIPGSGDGHRPLAEELRDLLRPGPSATANRAEEGTSQPAQPRERQARS